MSHLGCLKYLIFFALFFTQGHLSAKIIESNDQTDYYELKIDLDILEDPSKKLSIDDVKEMSV